MKVQIYHLDNHTTTDEKAMAVFETTLGILLPESYRAFLLVYNGGYPKPDNFGIPSHPIPNQIGILDIFLCLCPTSPYYLLEAYSIYKERMPQNLIPIAFDPGGNVICLSVKGEDIGKIYFWDHEDEVDEGETPTYENVFLIAETFDDLLNNKLMKISD